MASVWILIIAGFGCFAALLMASLYYHSRSRGIRQYHVDDLNILGVYRLVDGRVFRVKGHNIPEGGVVLSERPGRFDYTAVGDVYDVASREWLELPNSIPVAEIGDECPDPTATHFY